MKRRFAVTVSALVLAMQLGGPSAADEPSLEELTEISALLEQNDIEALRAYLLLRPDLLEGETPLAALLRQFMAESQNLAEYLGFQPDLQDAVSRALTSPAQPEPEPEPEPTEPDEAADPPAVLAPADPTTPAANEPPDLVLDPTDPILSPAPGASELY